MSYDITYMWILKYDTNELICETETDWVNIENRLVVAKGEEVTGGTEFGVQFSSVTSLCLTLCDPINHNTPGLPVHHQFPESTQTHFH